MKVCFITFGCRLNKAEALQMEADFLAQGWSVTDEHKVADLFVVRGCSVTRKAQEECERTISRLRRHYPRTPIHMCGCLTAGNPGEAGATGVSSRAMDALAARLASVPPSPSVPLRTARAYLKVQDGCAGKCSFCVVPRFRGKSTSVDFAGLMDRAKRFVDAGYHEIVVTGCNLSLYASQGRRLPDLIAALASVDAGCRIRLGSLEPGDCAVETVHAMAAASNVCRFLHLTVQSGSGRLLAVMRRSYGVREVTQTVDAATRLMPGLGLGCDLIVGFPGESELDFMATKSLLRRYPFVNAHVFPFSARPGTPAATFSHAVPHVVASARAKELSDVIRLSRRAFARRFLGKTVDVVVESEAKCAGWTGEYLRCEAMEPAPRKSAVRVVVTEVKKDELFGHVIKEQGEKT